MHKSISPEAQTAPYQEGLAGKLYQEIYHKYFELEELKLTHYAHMCIWVYIVFKCVCVYILYICMYIDTYLIYVCVNIYTDIYVCVCIYIHIIYMCVYVCICILYMCVYVYIRILCVCVCVHMYLIYISVCVNIIHTHVRTGWVSVYDTQYNLIQYVPVQINKTLIYLTDH